MYYYNSNPGKTIIADLKRKDSFIDDKELPSIILNELGQKILNLRKHGINL